MKYESQALSQPAIDALNQLGEAANLIRACDEHLRAAQLTSNETMPFLSQNSGRLRRQAQDLLVELDTFVATYSGRHS